MATLEELREQDNNQSLGRGETGTNLGGPPVTQTQSLNQDTGISSTIIIGSAAVVLLVGVIVFLLVQKSAAKVKR